MNGEATETWVSPYENMIGVDEDFTPLVGLRVIIGIDGEGDEAFRISLAPMENTHPLKLIGTLEYLKARLLRGMLGEDDE